MPLSEKQFTEVLKKYRPILYKVAHSYCRNKQEQPDLIQEITLQLWKAWPRYNKDFKISTWVYRIALNVAISYYRKEKNRTAVFSSTDKVSERLVENENHNGDLLIEKLYVFIHQLNPLNRALMLLYLDKNSYEDIASALGISKTNVATKISRIKKQLKKNFK